MSIMDKISNRNLYEFERTEPSLYSFSFLFEEITSLEEVFVKINIAMPVVFSVMFFFFPAGLVLYWVVNNILSIAQQWQINRMLKV